jgi:hypothetical protein
MIFGAQTGHFYAPMNFGYHIEGESASFAEGFMGIRFWTSG